MKRLPIAITLAVVGVLVLAGGVLAAQINFRGHLSAEEIVPLPVNYDSLSQGQAIFKLSEDGQSMNYKLNVANIDKVFMAHIHKFVGVGSNGPVLVWLYPSTNPGPGAPTGRVDGTLITGTFGPENLIGGVTWEQLLDMMRTGNAYVNIHSTDAPAGEINGLIH